MIIGILTNPSNFSIVKQFAWIKEYNFAVVTVDDFPNIETLVYLDKPKLFQYLQSIYGNLLVVGGLLVDSSFHHLVLSYGLFASTSTDMIQKSISHKLGEFANIYDITGGFTNQFLNELNALALKDKKDGITVSIEDSLQKAMKDLGLDFDDEDAAMEDLGYASQKSDSITIEVPKMPENTSEVDSEEITPTEKDLDDSTESIQTPSVEKQSIQIACNLEPSISSGEKELNIVSFDEMADASTNVSQLNTPKNLFMIQQSSEGLKLLVSSDLEVQTQVMDGQSYQVYFLNKSVTYSVANSIDAQPKVVKSEQSKVKQSEIKQRNTAQFNAKPPKMEQSKFDVSVFKTLEELVVAKTNVDAAIKAARSNNDEALVKSLRNQRHSIRAAINNWSKHHETPTA